MTKTLTQEPSHQALFIVGKIRVSDNDRVNQPIKTNGTKYKYFSPLQLPGIFSKVAISCIGERSGLRTVA